MFGRLVLPDSQPLTRFSGGSEAIRFLVAGRSSNISATDNRPVTICDTTLSSAPWEVLDVELGPAGSMRGVEGRGRGADGRAAAVAGAWLGPKATSYASSGIRDSQWAWRV